MIKKGFTLIEILVVISIIGILVALGTVSYTSSQKQARDAVRKSDLRQYQTALENFANGNNGLFPIRTGTPRASTALCGDLNVYFEPDIVCPEEIKSPTIDYYRYQANSTGTIYLLWAQLERNSSIYWVICSNGRVGEAASGIPPTGGNCPI